MHFITCNLYNNTYNLYNNTWNMYNYTCNQHNNTCYQYNNTCTSYFMSINHFIVHQINYSYKINAQGPIIRHPFSSYWNLLFPFGLDIHINKVQTCWLKIFIFFLLSTKSLSVTIFAIIVTGGVGILLLGQPHCK